MTQLELTDVQRALMEKKFRVAVEKLDAVRPDWHTRIDIDTLSLMSPSRCLLAQVFGSYDEGLRMLGYFAGDEQSGEEMSREVREVGGSFCAPTYKDLWIAEIALRLCAKEAQEDHEYLAPTCA